MLQDIWRIEAYDFHLPEDRVADRPAEPRETARLLRVTGQGLSDHRVGDLPGMLEPGDLLVFNDTKVIPARLFGRRGEVKVEFLLHYRIDAARWVAFARPAKRLRLGDRIGFEGAGATVEARGDGGEVTLRFDHSDNELNETIARIGVVPLPPYIRRAADARDRADYQTLFAREEGAVAAPTAGLHTTPALLDALAARGVAWTTLTLHVGAGTFLPVKVDDIRAHRMHAEHGRLGIDTISRIEETKHRGGRVIAVGTTSLRLLEASGGAPFAGPVDLFITPGYRFRVVDMLMTNFHLPRSTLFMLVAAFSGLDRMRAAYAHAIATGYRFYSYGDACLLDRIDA